MNNIIVGFDFSTGSSTAVDLAIDIANRWHRDLRLVYVKEKDEDDTPIRSEIERRNQGVAHLLKDIRLEYVIRSGKVSNELAAQAREDQAVLVVVGTNGMSGYKKNWIGKNTYSTITDSEVPVLCIREGFNFNKTLERILLPIDSTLTTRQKVPMALDFALTFNAEIDVLGLHSAKGNDVRRIVNDYVDQVDKLLYQKGVAHTVEFRDVDSDPAELVLNYADQKNDDLIVIMTEQEKALSDWLLGSSAEQLLHKSTRPILSIRPEFANASR
ncbi:MAG: universal stress protein [Bacteroidales bacterium]|nr:universal stress protein [Bacteroidales bacterium]